MAEHDAAAHWDRGADKGFPEGKIDQELALGIELSHDEMIKVPKQDVRDQVGRNKTDQSRFQPDGEKNKSEEQNLLDDEPDVIQLIVFEGS